MPEKLQFQNSEQGDVGTTSSSAPPPTATSSTNVTTSSKPDSQSMSSNSTTLSGMSTPLTHANIFHKNFGSRIRYDSQSRKEIELCWAREESKKLLDEFFVEFETEEEQGGMIGKLKEAAGSLSTGDKTSQREALKQISEIIMVREFVQIQH